MRLIASSSSNVNEEHVNAEPHQSLKKRLTSAFRGRQLVGTDISLPSGYVGLILRSETQPRLPPKQHPSSISGRSTRSARNTRGSRQSKPIEVDEVDEASMDVDADLLKGDEDESGNTKVLEPIQTFDTIRVWNADVSVDEGKDEYIRSLREWTALAASVRTNRQYEVSSFSNDSYNNRFIKWKTYET